MAKIMSASPQGLSRLRCIELILILALPVMVPMAPTSPGRSKVVVEKEIAASGRNVHPEIVNLNNMRFAIPNCA